CADACVRACDGLTCGPDGCGGECGACEGEQVCNAAGQCVDVGDSCGDDVCDDSEDCRSCPGDCGACCGDDVCGAGENCVTCPEDCACPAGEICDMEERLCEPEICEPQCDDRQCGDDGCDGVCGVCGGGRLCDPETGQCNAQCVPRCNGRQCGDNGCGGTCGECDDGAECNDGGMCVAECIPDCGDRECGNNGCGGSCGECEGDDMCGPDGMCGCIPDCDGRSCGDNGCGGSCGMCDGDDVCGDDGVCGPPCIPQCDGRSCGDNGCNGVCGVCDLDQICTADGRCLGGGVDCNCRAGEICLDGICRGPDVVCGADLPDGLCANGQVCVAGRCVDEGAGCSPQNATGVCPVGQLCRNGGCEPFDGEALCDDENSCTTDGFDYAFNRCVHVPVDGDCDDGNGCTMDRCVDGECVATPIDGCVAPPTIGPYTSPTNVGELTITGSKPVGSAIQINGELAVPESPEEEWAVMVNLVPGDNVYRIRSVDMGEQSEEVVVRVVFDITPPNTRVNPEGGTFLDGISVTVATDEPATVYYTTDGSTPSEFSDSFVSARTFRIFDDTTLKFRARDVAGNWEPLEEGEDAKAATFRITGDGNGWDAGPTLPEALTLPGVAADGMAVYVVGGSDGMAVQAGAAAWRYAEDAWENLPALPIARAQHTLVSYGNQLYAFGGEDDGLPFNLVSRLNPNGGMEWENRRPMPTTRFGLSAAPHGNRIYVFGGKTNGGVVLDTLEVYDPAADNWTNMVAQMPRPRYGFTAITDDLNDKIYLIGGEDEEGVPIAEVDVFVPGTGMWEEAPPLPTPRSFATVTINANVGAVTGGFQGLVVAGGRIVGGNASAVVEEYIIDRDEWVQRTPLPQPRHSAGGATILMEGDVDSQEQRGYIFGGLVGDPGGQEVDALTDSSAYYAHTQDYLRRLTDLPEGRFMHAAATLGNRIYLFGGRDFAEVTEGWSFDPETGTYDVIEELPNQQNGLSAVVMNERVWAIGGANSFGLAVPWNRSYDPATDSWTDHQPMLSGRRDAAAAVLNGQIWVIGGDNNGALQSVEVYDPVTDRWTNGPLLPAPRAGAHAFQYQGRIYLVGGRDGAGAISGQVLLLDTRNTPQFDDDVWSVREGNALPVTDAVGAIMNGNFLLLGGRTANGLSNQRWQYNVASRQVMDVWTPMTRLLEPYNFAAGTVFNGEIYVFGGNASADMPGPGGALAVQKLRGTCMNGVADAYEGTSPRRTFDSGGGCGLIEDRVVALNAGYGHHGGCGSWNGCGNAATCAAWACAIEGHGAAVSWDSTNNCPGLPTCHAFNNRDSIDRNFRGCSLPGAHNIVCEER
ncbi:MAG: Kelch repeat-containing protein, partial [Planctomycetota bacterium]